MDFTGWMGFTANALDYEFHSLDQIPRIVSDIAGLCVSAAQVNPQACPFAMESLNASDPVADLNHRIDYILTNLTDSAYIDPVLNKVFSFDTVSNDIVFNIYSPRQFPNLAQILLDTENAIKSGNRANFSHLNSRSLSSGSNSNLPFSLFNQNDPLAGEDNPFLFPAILCLEANFSGLDNPTIFAEHVSKLVEISPLPAYISIFVAFCLGWPNLSSYNVERFTENIFPSNIRDKLLIIGGTNDAITPFHGALDTYEYVGSGNANFLIHDGYGHCSIANPNNCTNAAIRNFISNGDTICTLFSKS